MDLVRAREGFFLSGPGRTAPGSTAPGPGTAPGRGPAGGPRERPWRRPRAGPPGHGRVTFRRIRRSAGIHLAFEALSRWRWIAGVLRCPAEPRAPLAGLRVR